MKLNCNSVLVDTDFLSHIIETKIDNDQLTHILKEAFTFLKIRAFIHPLVYANELNPPFRSLPFFLEKAIEKAEFVDIHLDDPSRKKYYIFMVKELYSSLFGEDLDFSNEEIFKKWICGKSLGEIHSLSACLLCECCMFLSDDKDSKYLQRIINKKCLGAVKVFNRKEFFGAYVDNGGKNIPRSDRRQISHEKNM